MAQTFTADLKKILAGYEQDLLNVAKQSIQEVVSTAQTPKARGGRMPVDTGFLRNSLISGVNGAFGPQGEDSYVFAIAQLKLGDTSRFAWTAAYAMRMELGYSGADALGRIYEQEGNHFVGSAAAQWEDIVRKNALKVRARRS